MNVSKKFDGIIGYLRMNYGDFSKRLEKVSDELIAETARLCAAYVSFTESLTDDCVVDPDHYNRLREKASSLIAAGICGAIGRDTFIRSYIECVKMFVSGLAAYDTARFEDPDEDEYI